MRTYTQLCPITYLSNYLFISDNPRCPLITWSYYSAISVAVSINSISGNDIIFNVLYTVPLCVY